MFRGIEGYKIFHKSLLESILWSDIVVFYGSSACIDALIQKKHIIFLEFATSNKLDESLYEYVVKCQTPDDFIVEIDNLYMNGIKKCETLHFPKVESVINEWKELLDID